MSQQIILALMLLKYLYTIEYLALKILGELKLVTLCKTVLFCGSCLPPMQLIKDPKPSFRPRLQKLRRCNLLWVSRRLMLYKMQLSYSAQAAGQYNPF